ncbi:MAG: KxYKxGKxW signal peptide domain-containing protein [Paramuribaculum sp.]|nr:KxYKxGKxW signal peptide domain-containing protein [Paramuribaculum sp.]
MKTCQHYKMYLCGKK